MAEGISKSDLEEVFAKFFGGAGGAKPLTMDPTDVAAFKKQIKESTDLMKKSLPLSKQAEQLLRGQRAAAVDVTKELEELDKQIQKLADTAKDSNDNEAVYQLQRQRNNKEQAAGVLNAKIAMQNFGVGLGEVASTMLKGAFQYAKDLQSGASGVEAGSAAAATAARVTGDTISMFGQTMSAAGPLVGQFVKRVPWLGAAITGVGVIMDIFGKKAADVGEAGLKFLGDELKKTTRAFSDINSTGAVFAGGMTELRNVAAGAGLDVAQLATAVKGSKDDLVGMGLGLGEATKRLAGVSKELRTSDLGIQLRKLGYGAEEQFQLAASVSARMSAAGDTRIRSDAEVAKMTVQYGKDLKVLGDITGADAKKALEAARIKAQEQDLLAEAMAKGGPEAVKKLEAQLATMPETMKKGYMEFVSTGGTAIADAATNVAITQNPKIMDQYRQQYNTLSDQNKDSSAAMRESSKLNEDTFAYAKDHAAASKEIAMAARLTGSSIARGATDITNGLILGAAKQQKGATEAADLAADAASKNMAPLDASVAGVDEAAQKLKAAMGQELTSHVTTFAKTLAAGTETVGEALKKLGITMPSMAPSTSEKVGGAAGGILGGMGGAALGAMIGTMILPGIGTAIGAGLGGLAGGWGGEKAGSAAGQAIHKFGDGGIVTGPTRAIIGEAGMNEAVIPLPNGKSVPLDLDMAGIKQAFADIAGAAIKMGPVGAAVGAGMNAIGSITGGGSDTAQEQISLLREIREVLAGSKDLQQQFVQNTYA